MTATAEHAVIQEPPSEQRASCLYCGSQNFAEHFRGIQDRLRYVPGEWSFERCLRCESLRLSPFPAEEAIADFYPPVYSFNLNLAKESRIKRLLTWLEYAVFFGPQYRGQANQVLRGIGWQGERGLRMLDIGCGRGLRLKAFQSRGFDVHGLDLQPEVVEYVRHELGIAASVGGVDSLASNLEAGSFDVITAFYLLEHVSDVQAVLRDCQRLLRPGGWFVGVVPVCDGLQARLFGKRWLHVTEAPRHLSLPSRAGLLTAAENAGYDRAHLRSDSVLNCAGIVAGSLLPGSDITAAYGKRRWMLPMLRRIVGGGLAMGAVPLCLIENHLLGQTSHGMLLARKPRA